VLVHCCAGVHRTGAYCAIYRMEFEGWTNAEALAEMKALGYSNLDEEWDIRGYLESYRRGERVRIPTPSTARAQPPK
jgi:protein tyrosine/serine phosphatase